MIGVLVRRNLRHQRGLLAGIVLGLIGLQVFFVQIAASFDESGAFEQLFALMPPMIRMFVGFDLSNMTLTTFVAFGYQHPAVLAGVIAFTVFSASTLAGDRDADTLDLFLARPLPRTAYLASVLATFATGAVLLATSVFVGSALGLALVTDATPDPLPWNVYIGCALGLLTFLLAVGGFTVLLSTFVKRRGTAAAQVVATLVTLYIVEVTADLSETVAMFRVLSPFHYFKPVQWAISPPMPISAPLILVGVCVVSSALALARFRTRDI